MKHRAFIEFSRLSIRRFCTLAAATALAACQQTLGSVPIPCGTVTTMAGTASVSGTIDGAGVAARFNRPAGATDDGVNLFIADSYNHTIRRVVIQSGEVTTLAGSAGSNGSVDGTGTAARFNIPSGITSDGVNLYVADCNNSIIRKIMISTGEVTTLAGSAGSNGSADGTGAAARFNYPRGIAGSGEYLYVADTNNHTIRRILISTGEVTTLAGTAGVGGSVDGTGTAARFLNPYGITSADGSLFIADSGNNTIRKIALSSVEVATLVGTAGACGNSDGTGTAARFNYPMGIAEDGVDLYVADSANHTIRRIVISTGEVTTLAGTAGVGGSVDGTGTAARFVNPYGLTSSGAGLFVADSLNHTIRAVTK